MRKLAQGNSRSAIAEEDVVDLGTGQEPPITDVKNVLVEDVEVPAHVRAELPPAESSVSSLSATDTSETRSTPPSLPGSEEGGGNGTEGKGLHEASTPAATPDSSVSVLEERGEEGGDEGVQGAEDEGGEEGEDDDEEEEEEEEQEIIVNNETNAGEADEHAEEVVEKEEEDHGLKDDEGGGTEAPALQLGLPAPLLTDTGGRIEGDIDSRIEGSIDSQDDKELAPLAGMRSAVLSMPTDKGAGVEADGAAAPSLPSEGVGPSPSPCSSSSALVASTSATGAALERRALQRLLRRRLSTLPDDATPSSSPTSPGHETSNSTTDDAIHTPTTSPASPGHKTSTDPMTLTQTRGLRDDMQAALEQLRQDGVCITRLSRSLRSSARRLQALSTRNKRAEAAAAKAHKKHARLCHQINVLKALLAPSPPQHAGTKEAAGGGEEGGAETLLPGSASAEASSPSRSTVATEQYVLSLPTASVNGTTQALPHNIARVTGTSADAKADDSVKADGAVKKDDSVKREDSAKKDGASKKDGAVKKAGGGVKADGASKKDGAVKKASDAVKGPVAAAVARLESASTSVQRTVKEAPLCRQAGAGARPMTFLPIPLSDHTASPKRPMQQQQHLASADGGGARGSPSHHTHNQRMRPAAVRCPPAQAGQKPALPVAPTPLRPPAEPSAGVAPPLPLPLPPTDKDKAPLPPPVVRAPRHTGVAQATTTLDTSNKPKPPHPPVALKGACELCPEAAAHRFLSTRCRSSSLSSSALPPWAPVVLARLPQRPSPSTSTAPLFPFPSPFVLPALLHINAFLPPTQQLTPLHVSLLALPPAVPPLPPAPLQPCALLLAHPTPIDRQHRGLVRLHPSRANHEDIRAQHDFLKDIAGRLVLRGAMHTWGPGYFRCHDPQAGTTYVLHFRDLSGLEGGKERVGACNDSTLRGLLRGRGACLDPVHEVISLSRAVSVFPLPAGTGTLREAHRTCFFKHASKGRGRVSRLLVEMVRLLGLLRDADVACCHLSPDDVLLVPGDGHGRFSLMVKSLEHGVSAASKTMSRRLGSWAMQPPETILGLAAASTAAAQDVWAGGMLVLWCAVGELTWTSDLVGLVDPWRRGRTTPATAGETAGLASGFSAAVDRMLRALALKKAGGRGLLNVEAHKALRDLLGLDPSARVAALCRHAKTVAPSKGAKAAASKARGPPTAAGEVRKAAKGGQGKKKGGKKGGGFWRWGGRGKGPEELTAMYKEEIGRTLFESAHPTVTAEIFAQYKAKHRCVDACVGEGGHGCVSGYTPLLPWIKRLFTNHKPTLALKNMDDPQYSIRGKAEREVALHQAVAHLPSGTHVSHYRIHGQHEAEYFMPFKRVMLDDLMAGDFFWGGPVEVNRVRWLRLLYLLCDALRSYRALDLAHRDLKPNNIAVDFTESTFYITVLDWGEGCFRASTTPITPRIGTPGYQPVEVMAGLGGYMVGSSHDITSVGRIMVKAAVGRTTWTEQARVVLRDWGRLLDAHYENRLHRLEPWLRDLCPQRLSCALQTEASRFVSDVAGQGLATPAALPMLRALLSPDPQVKEQIFAMNFENIFGALVH